MTKNFQRRSKGKRYSKSMLPMFTFGKGRVAICHDPDTGSHTKIGTIEVLGGFWGYSPFGEKVRFQRLAVTLLDGTRVPAIRQTRRGGNFAVVQDYTLLVQNAK